MSLPGQCVVPVYDKSICQLSNDAATCKRGWDIYTSVEQCCARFGGCASPTTAPSACYTPDSFWPDRTCKAVSKCDVLYPRTNVFASGEECCTKSFADGCRVAPTTCRGCSGCGG